MRLREQLGGFRQRVRSTRTGRLTLQIAIGTLGGIVVIIGLILIPFPGPGWLIVLAGLAIWAIEFVWAERLLHFTRTRLELWWRWLGRQHILVRLLAGVVGIVFVGTMVVLSLEYSFGINALGTIWDFITAH